MTRRQMAWEDMVISERWRWRLVAIWLIVFSLLVSFALFRVQDLADENKDALCAIHRTHVLDDQSLLLLMERNNLDVEEITQRIEAERAELTALGCHEQP